MARYAETLPTDSLSSCVPPLFTCLQRKGSQRHLVAATNKRKGRKTTRSCSRKFPKPCGLHRDEGQRPKHVKTLEVRILPVVKDSLKFQPWFWTQPFPVLKSE